MGSTQRTHKYTLLLEQIAADEIFDFVRAARDYCAAEKRKAPKILLAVLDLFVSDRIRDAVPWSRVHAAAGWSEETLGLDKRRATLVDDLRDLCFEMCCVINWETQRPYNHHWLSISTRRRVGIDFCRISRYRGEPVGAVVRKRLRERKNALTSRSAALNEREIQELAALQEELGDVEQVPSVIGHYRVERSLGGGGTGSVFAVEHTLTGEHFALKLMHSHLGLDRAQRERFFRGAKAMLKLSHPNIIHVVDAGSVYRTRPYYAAELVEGGTLIGLIETDTRPSSKDLLSLLGKVVSALAEAHRKGVIHRDVKPENILIDSAGEPKLTDFDCAYVPSIPSLPTALAGGTLQYMSPERLKEPTRHDARDDVYAFGIVALEALSGLRLGRPQEMYNCLQDRGEHPALLQVIMKCIMPEPFRYKSAVELEVDWRAVSESKLIPGAALPIWIDPASSLYYADRWMPNQKLEKKYLARSNFRNATMTGTSFARSVLTNTVMMGADLQDCCFDGALMIGARMHGAKLRGATFRMADLERTVWDDVDLAGVDFSGSNFWGAFLERSKNLDNAILEGANFARNPLTPEQELFLRNHPSITRADRYRPFLELAHERYGETLPEELWWASVVLEDQGLMYY